MIKDVEKLIYSCDYCNKDFPITKTRYRLLKTGKQKSSYCCKECADKAQTTLKIKICSHCGKEYKITNYFSESSKFCSRECYFNSKKRNTKICPSCNKEYNPKRKNQKFCCNECKFQASKKEVKIICANCGTEKLIPQNEYDRATLHFCTRKCFDEYRQETRVCPVCQTSFMTKRSSKQIYCNQNCYFESLKTTVGALTESREFRKCNYCGSEFLTYKRNDQKFCSVDCKNLWLKDNIFNSDEFKEKARKNLAKNFGRDNFNPNTGIQIKINQLLNEMGIIFENEKVFDYYVADNYLTQHNLIIEVMGEFWHSDIRRYPLYPNGELNIKIIRSDKAKRTYIKNKYNIDILYLWERDIENNPLLCKKLIEKYIKEKGNLRNYHSLNYSLVNNELVLNSDILYPYQEQKTVLKIIPRKKVNLN